MEDDIFMLFVASSRHTSTYTHMYIQSQYTLCVFIYLMPSSLSCWIFQLCVLVCWRCVFVVCFIRSFRSNLFIPSLHFLRLFLIRFSRVGVCVCACGLVRGSYVYARVFHICTLCIFFSSLHYCCCYLSSSSHSLFAFLIGIYRVIFIQSYLHTHSDSDTHI